MLTSASLRRRNWWPRSAVTTKCSPPASASLRTARASDRDLPAVLPRGARRHGDAGERAGSGAAQRAAEFGQEHVADQQAPDVVQRAGARHGESSPTGDQRHQLVVGAAGEDGGVGGGVGQPGGQELGEFQVRVEQLQRRGAVIAASERQHRDDVGVADAVGAQQLVDLAVGVVPRHADPGLFSQAPGRAVPDAVAGLLHLHQHGESGRARLAREVDQQRVGVVPRHARLQREVQRDHGLLEPGEGGVEPVHPHGVNRLRRDGALRQLLDDVYEFAALVVPDHDPATLQLVGDLARQVIVKGMHGQGTHEREEASQRPAAPARIGSRKDPAAPSTSSSVAQRSLSSACIRAYFAVHSLGGSGRRAGAA
jgi:hypothetical protein